MNICARPLNANAEKLISRNKKDREGRDIHFQPVDTTSFPFSFLSVPLLKRDYSERMFLTNLKPSNERISFGFTIGVDTVDKGWPLTLDRTRPATTASS